MCAKLIPKLKPKDYYTFYLGHIELIEVIFLGGN